MKLNKILERPRIVAVAAISDNGMIGLPCKAPWYYEEERNHHWSIIENQDVVIGGGFIREWESELCSRGCTVHTFDGWTASSASIIKKVLTPLDLKVVYILGWESVFEHFLTEMDEMIISHVKKSVKKSRAFPLTDLLNWRVVETKSIHHEVEVVRYERRSPRYLRRHTLQTGPMED